MAFVPNGASILHKYGAMVEGKGLNPPQVHEYLP